MLSLPEGPDPAPLASVIYYAVDNIQEAVRTLAARGVAFEGDAHLIAKLPHADLWMAFFRDPDRHLLALMSEVKPA